MTNAEHKAQSSPATQPWRELILSIVVVGTGVLCLLAWILPDEKPEAIFGRLSYWQSGVAVASTILFVSAALLLFSPAKCRRRRGFRLTALWLGGTVALVLAEGMAWLLPARQPQDNPWYTFTTGAGSIMEQSDALMFERPPHVRWEGETRGDFAIYQNVPDPYARTVRFRTDHEGFRNSEDIYQADIIFIGDSHTEAGNMPEPETFVARTGAALGLRARNLGRASHCPSAELIILKRFGLKCEPNVVVWQFCENNDMEEEILFHRWNTNGRPPVAEVRNKPTRQDAWKWRSPTYRLFTKWRQPEPWQFQGTFHDAEGNEHPMLFDGPQHPAQGHPGWTLMAEALREGTALLKDRGIELIVIHIPKKVRVMGAHVEFNALTRENLPADWDLEPQETLGWQLDRQCRELDVPFIDTTAVLRERAAAGTMVYLPMDSHLSSDGHAVVAEQIVEAISALEESTEAARRQDGSSTSR